ncbi:MAG: hypothetical protein JSV20_00105 [Candidatus Bathyarchaeota archaeon]|nr:MAG: hypothetical protein JSV20_00105 [Candidatus Bathyarchaeota archaeon]
MPFPKAVDYHKPSKPLIPNCYGIFYSFISVCYWFTLSFFGIMEQESLALATSVLFGSTMGLFDDIVDLSWRYKAILPIFASLPYMVLKPSDRTTISLLLLGYIDFGALFFIIIVPLIVTVTTNIYNQLGGLNGLESLSGLIILIGLTIASGSIVLTIVPILCLVLLGYLSYKGQAFIGNVGTFSIGITLAVYSILFNIKLVLLVTLVPHIVNSLLILYSIYVLNDKAETLMDENGLLYSHRIRSLRTLILHYKRMKEHDVVLLLCLMIVLFVISSLIIKWFSY